MNQLRALSLALIVAGTLLMSACSRNTLSTIPEISPSRNVGAPATAGVLRTNESTTDSSPNFFCGYCTPAPGSPEDSPEQCADMMVNCSLVVGEINADLSYSSGDNSAGTQVWTAYPWACIQGSNGYWTSSIDLIGCDAWQLYHYYGQWCPAGHTPCEPVPGSDSYEISIGISTAASSDVNIPTAGHLYIQGWYLGQPYYPGQKYAWQGENDNGHIGPGNFPQSPLTQPHFFLPVASSQAYALMGALQSNTNVYQANLNAGKAPLYNATDPNNGPNSNTYADGLLLSVGVPQSQIDAAVSELQSRSGLRPYAYGAGGALEPLF